MATLIVGLLCFNVQAQDNDLILNLPLDQDANDVSIYGNDGILHCPFVTVPDRHGNPEGAMFFDGDDDYIEVPQSATFSPEGDVTISYWLNREAEQNPNSYEPDSFVVALDEVRNESAPIYMRMSGGNPTIRVNNIHAWNVHPNIWTHVAAVIEGTFVQIYVNGVLEATGYMGKTFRSEGPLYIGSLRGMDYDYHGALDDFQMLSRAMTADEIKVLAEVEPAEDGLILNMPLDDQSAEDVSGLQNDGIKYGDLASAEDRDGNSEGAIYFDGDKDYIVVPLTATYDVQDEYSLSFWIQRGSANGNSFVMYSNNVYLLLSGDDQNHPGRIMFENVVAYDLQIGEWAHITCTAKANDKRQIFVNGVLVDSSPASSIEYPNMDLAIGARHGPGGTDHEFTGSLDDVKVFNHVLSDEEVAVLAEVEPEPEPEECIPVSEIEECVETVCEECPEQEVCPEPEVCETCEICEVCPEIPEPVVCPEIPEPVECPEVTNTELNADLKKLKLHKNSLQVHMRGVQNTGELAEGAATVTITVEQNGKKVSYTAAATLSQHGVNLMDVNSANKAKARKAKARKAKKGKGKSCKK